MCFLFHDWRVIKKRVGTTEIMYAPTGFHQLKSAGRMSVVVVIERCRDCRVERSYIKDAEGTKENYDIDIAREQLKDIPEL